MKYLYKTRFITKFKKRISLKSKLYYKVNKILYIEKKMRII